MTTKCGVVTIIGRPNSGKSTLLNAVVGSHLSIVTPKPQTTRRKVLGIYTSSQTQVLFIDTPGVLQPKYQLQETMMGYVRESLEEADLIAVLLDLTKIEQSASFLTEEFREALKTTKTPSVLILNKIDALKDKREVLPLMAKFAQTGIFRDIVPISALANDNVDRLLEVITSYMPEGEFLFNPDDISTQSQRFFVAEFIRETIFDMMDKEVPYSCDVVIVEFKERENGKWYISADIIVSRDNQKAILIGEGGKTIQEIGKLSRAKIEPFLELPIFLELRVKVRESWRDNEGMLRSLGY